MVLIPRSNHMTKKEVEAIPRYFTPEEADYYKSLGYFVVSFERLVQEIRNFIVESLVCGGLKSKETGHHLLVNFNNPKLQDYLLSVFKRTFKDSKEDHTRLKKFGMKFLDCFKFRNSLIHAVHTLQFYGLVYYIHKDN